MVTFCSISDLEEVNQALENLEFNNPELHEKLVEMVHLTHALNFKFQYLGALILDKPFAEFAPHSAHYSVLRIYNRELQELKGMPDFNELKQLISKYTYIGVTNISNLILGIEPHSLVGPSVER